MPEIGEIRRGRDCGKPKNPAGHFIYKACVDCGLIRWVNFNNVQLPAERCLSCSIKNTIIIHGHPWKGRHHSEESKKKISEAQFNHGMRGGRHWKWKGGRFKDNDYFLVKLEPNDPFYPMIENRKSHKGYIPEHRLIMAQHLNRCLFTWEVVHHINGNKSDNRIENLQLMKSQYYHFPGIRRNQYIKKLENKIKELEEENTSLKTKA